LKTTIISSESESVLSYITNVWRCRALIFVLARRDMNIRFSQTLFGIFWSFVQPLVALFIYSIFFYKILGINTNNVPYPLFVFPGVMVWFHFIQLVNETGTCLQSNQELIRKVSFPKLIIPLSKIICTSMEVVISFFLLVIMLFIYDVDVTARLIFFPLILMINILLGFSIGIWISSLTIKYRDFHHIIPFLVNFLIWISPVFYPSTILPDNLEYLIFINPISSVLCLYRWCLIGMPLPEGILLYNLIPSLLILTLGLVYFKNNEKKIVDFV